MELKENCATELALFLLVSVEFPMMVIYPQTEKSLRYNQSLKKG